MEVDDDPYMILEVSVDASAAEIRKKYRKLALVHHPDRQTTDEGRERCHNIFARLSAAYEILSDEEQRAQYDLERQDENMEPHEYETSEEEEPEGDGSDVDGTQSEEESSSGQPDEEHQTPPSSPKKANTSSQNPSSNKGGFPKPPFWAKRKVEPPTTPKDSDTRPKTAPPSNEEREVTKDSPKKQFPNPFGMRFGFSNKDASKYTSTDSTEKPSSFSGRPQERRARAPASPNTSKPAKPSSFSSFSPRARPSRPTTSPHSTSKPSSFSSPNGRPSRPPSGPANTKPTKPSSFSTFSPRASPSRPPPAPTANKPTEPSSSWSFNSGGRSSRPPPIPSSPNPDKAFSFSSFSPRMSARASTKPSPSSNVKPSSYSMGPGASVKVTNQRVGGVPAPPLKTKDPPTTNRKVKRDPTTSKPTKKSKSTTTKRSKHLPRQSSLKGYKYSDPYEVFRKVFRDEFGEEFVPGARPKKSSPLPPKPKSSSSVKMAGSSPYSAKSGKKPVSQQQRPPSFKKQKDGRAMAGKTQTRQILHDNGMVETITTTIIERANGEKERITKSSMEKLSKAEHEKMCRERAQRAKKQTTQIPPSPSRKTRVVR